MTLHMQQQRACDEALQYRARVTPDKKTSIHVRSQGRVREGGIETSTQLRHVANRLPPHQTLWQHTFCWAGRSIEPFYDVRTELNNAHTHTRTRIHPSLPYSSTHAHAHASGVNFFAPFRRRVPACRSDFTRAPHHFRPAVLCMMDDGFVPAAGVPSTSSPSSAAEPNARGSPTPK